MNMSDLKIDMNDMIMTDSPIRFPGLFSDWTFTASSKAIDVGHGVYWYGVLIAPGPAAGPAAVYEGACKIRHQ